MALSERARVAVRLFATFVAIGAIVGAVLGGFVFGEVGTLSEVVQGALIGSTIAGLCGGFEIFFLRRTPGEPLLRAPFLVLVLTRTVVYMLVGLASVYGWQVAYGQSLEGYRIGETNFFVIAAIIFVLGFSFNFVLAMQRMVGTGVLASFVTGRYHHPVEEERVFMFLDLVDSTWIAERIGHVAYHRLLSQLWFDLTDPVLAHRGEIHKYVGDGVIVTWPLARGVAQARCVQCYFDFEARLQATRRRYERDFGIVPAFRAALHAGVVVAGEVGDAKQEIAFVGDTVNTTARMLQACRAHDRPVLISGDLLRELRLPPEVRAEPVAEETLRGRSTTLALHALARVPTPG